MFKLKKFNIERYKSILNSGECLVQDQITVLAGKNESGKTSILEAINNLDLKEEKTFEERDRTIGQKDISIITAWFEIESNKLYSILSEFSKENDFLLNEEQKKGISKKGSLILRVGEENVELEGGFYESLTDLADKRNTEIIEGVISVENKFREFRDQMTKKEIVIPEVNWDANLEEEVSRFVESLKNSREELLEIFSKNEKFSSTLSFLENSNKNVLGESFDENLGGFIVSKLPEIIFFREFDEEKIKDSMSFEEAKNSQFVKDLKKITGGDFDIDKIIEKQADEHWVELFQSKFTAKVTQDFMEYWDINKKDKINQVEIRVRIANGKISFFICNPRTQDLVYPSQRSKGFQWFLSFYTRICSSVNGKENKIILIDEPGLFLHAKAQKSVLKVLNTVFKNDQIIYSTHSPYLIEENKLERIRLVERKSEDRYSKIINNFYDSKDQDTLTPILTAIGHDIFSGITFENNKRCIIVEGISDYLILKKLFNTLDPTFLNSHHIIPMKGADSIPKYIPFFIGWGIDFLIILDSDSKGDQISTQIKEKWLVDKKNILFVSQRPSETIEDLFTHEEYFKKILEQQNYDIKKKISAQINNSKKVMASKELEKKMSEGKITLSPTTRRRFEELLEQIKKYYGL